MMKMRFFPRERGEKKDDELLAFRISWKRTILDLVILAVSGGSLTLSFPGMDLPLFNWVSVVPLLWLCVHATRKRAFWYGMVWGYFWNMTATFFLREICIAIPFVFGAVLGLFCAFWSMLVPVFHTTLLYPAEVRVRGSAAMSRFHDFQCRDEFLVIFALSIWWILLEWLRSWIFTGFPWGLLAVSLWKNLPMIQIAEYTGIYGVSFLVVFMNLSVFFGARRLIFGFLYENKFKRPFPLYFALFALALNFAVGVRTMTRYNKLYRSENVNYFPVGVVQPDLSQRRYGGFDSRMEALNICRDLSEQLIAENNGIDSIAVDSSEPELKKREQYMSLKLIVWPETAVPAFYYNNDDFSRIYRRTVRGMMARGNLKFLIGTLMVRNVRSNTDYDYYNTALLLKPGAEVSDSPEQIDFDDAYDKVHIVPFGEFIPLNDKFPIIGQLVGMGRNLSRGTHFRPLDIANDVHAGVQICYEDVFAYISRSLVKNGANFLMVITNDAWYPTSTEPIQHYANSIFRAIETRMPLVRCGNSNYSVLVDAIGRTVDAACLEYDAKLGKMVPDPGKQKAVCAKFAVPVLKNYKPTFYVVFGDFFMIAAGFAFFLLVLFAFHRQTRYCKALKEPLA